MLRSISSWAMLPAKPTTARDKPAQKRVEANAPRKKDKAAGEDRYVAIKKPLTVLNATAVRGTTMWLLFLLGVRSGLMSALLA